MKKAFLIISILCLGAGSLLAQAQKVAGTVTNAEDGGPLPGVTVLISGTITGTVTGPDGKYSLEVPAGATLMFSFVGMMTQEVVVGGRQVIDVVLKTGATPIGEVVVTALGITRSKKALGYATTSFNAEEIAGTKAINPLTAMQGKVAGMDVSSSPGAGTTQNVIIRGFSSFGNNQPLYIVDGVPVTNSQNRSGDDLNAQIDFGSGINALNPDDIANVTVLKGAAATALYGSRAANGVIMITTKTGKDTQGKVQITYDGSVNFTRIGFLPKEQELFGQGWNGNRALGENGSWGAAFDGKDRVWGNIVDGQQKIKPYVYLNNRIRDFYDLGVGTNNAVSLSGGNERTNYFLSLSQNYLNGAIPTKNDAYNRYTIGTRASHKADKLTVSTSVNFSTERNRAIASGQGSSLLRSLNEIATDISIVDLKDYKNDPFNTLDNYFTPYGLNPYFVLNENGAEQSKQKIFGKFQVDYDILKNLQVTYRFGGDYETSVSDTHTAVVKFTPGSINDLNQGPVNPGDYEQRRLRRVQMNHDAYATFTDRFGDFSLNAIVGLNVNERSASQLVGYVTSIDVPGFYNLSNSLTPAVSSQESTLRRLIGVYLNADIGFKDYAYLTLTARNDWSSTLPKGNNTFFYPGAMFSFLLTDFLQTQNINTGVVDFAKIRIAYGQTGNDADSYFVYNQYRSGSILNPGYPEVDNLTFPLGGVNAWTVDNTRANSELKPELTREFEVGAELSLFGNRLGFDVSYYNRFTKGLIESLPKDPSTGYLWQMSNLGDVRNQGVELTVNLVPVSIGDFRWDLSYNFSLNKNKVERLDIDEIYLSGFGGMGIYAVEGKPLGQFKTYRTRTVNIDGVDRPIVDGSGNPISTPDMEYVGKDINEKYRMGLTTTFSWRGLSLTGTFDFRYGGYIYSYTKDYMHWTGSAPESALNSRYPFLVPNSVIDNGDGSYSENTTPVDPTQLHTFYSTGGFKKDEFAIIDRSYLKLRNLGISYQLPRKLTDAMKISSLRISANVSNILLWTPVENQYIDPETTTFGNDLAAKFGEFGANPPFQTYTIGLNLTF